MEKKIAQTTNELAVNEKVVEQFKSIYYLLKGKRDTDIKLFRDFKQFRYLDILDLNRKIYKKLELHQLVTDIVTVTIGLDNKEIKTFGNWNEFTLHDWQIPECTKYLSIEWDFNIILPNQIQQIPQTHTLRVRLGNGLKPNEMLQVIFQGGEEHEYEEASSQAVCKIDFVNAQICTELKNVVTLWYEGLPKNSEDQKFVPFIARHIQKVKQIIITLFLLAGVILTNVLIFHFTESFEINDNNSLLEKFYLLFSVALIILYVFYISGRLYSKRLIDRNIEKLKRNPMFEITKGDENRLVDVKKDNNKHLRNLGLGMAASLLANLVAFGVGKLIIQIAEMIK
jgi:hypothetical protein